MQPTPEEQEGALDGKCVSARPLHQCVALVELLGQRASGPKPKRAASLARRLGVGASHATCTRALFSRHLLGDDRSRPPASRYSLVWRVSGIADADNCLQFTGGFARGSTASHSTLLRESPSLLPDCHIDISQCRHTCRAQSPILHEGGIKPQLHPQDR